MSLSGRNGGTGTGIHSPGASAPGSVMTSRHILSPPWMLGALSLSPAGVSWHGVGWISPAGSGGAVRGAEDTVNLGCTRNFLHPGAIQMFFDELHAMSCVGLSPGAENTAEFITFFLPNFLTPDLFSHCHLFPSSFSFYPWIPQA